MTPRIFLSLLATLLLTGCFMTPGKFVSALEIEKDGAFQFSYDGEIQMLGMSQLARMKEASSEFEPYQCYDNAEPYDVRPCTEEELAEQRAQWDAQASTRQENETREAAQFKQLFGGIDPTDPEAAQELAKLLERQRGWDSVEHKGDGLFEVSFSITGMLSHAFAFPVIENMPMTSPFVTVIERDDGKLRIDAPGFASRGAGDPFITGMLGGFLTMGPGEGADGPEGAGSGELPFAKLEGTFTITTDGEILANNTDEGAVALGKKRSLSWDVSARSKDAPTALIQLER